MRKEFLELFHKIGSITPNNFPANVQQYVSLQLAFIEEYGRVKWTEVWLQPNGRR